MKHKAKRAASLALGLGLALQLGTAASAQGVPTGGYENGTVTCWIVVETENGAVSGIGNVVIAGNEKQSFISYISDENLAHFGESFDGSDFELADWKNNNLTGGASMSTTAIINSVNIAKNFVSANLISGGENA